MLRLVTASGEVTPRRILGGADLRLGRIRTARARISAGYYDRPDVRERVVAAVLEDLDGS